MEVLDPGEVGLSRLGMAYVLARPDKAIDPARDLQVQSPKAQNGSAGDEV